MWVKERKTTYYLATKHTDHNVQTIKTETKDIQPVGTILDWPVTPLIPLQRTILLATCN